MTLSEELAWRGFVNQTTLKDAAELDKKTFSFYWGVDPSDSSMTVGNLAAAMMVRHFIEHGHKAVLLVGGATGMIGDPDGKDEERDLKSLETIERNKAGITAQYQRIFEGQPFTVVDNYDWFKNVNYLSFLRDIGKHFPMTQLLDRDFVQSRIGKDGKGISYAEFSYSLIQGYDFLHLHRTEGVELQVCGADQWGNSLSGVELIRRLEGRSAHVWSAPLVLNKATGKKFGKSEAGAVWLDEAKTSVFQFYQFWLNVDDEGAIDYLKIYTLLDQAEIERAADAAKQAPHERQAQKTLAFEVTKLVHGTERAQLVKRVTDVLFGSEAFTNISPAEIATLKTEIPHVQPGRTVVAALVESGLAASNGEALRFLKAGAVAINGDKLSEDRPLAAEETPLLIKRGKNGFCLVSA